MIVEGRHGRYHVGDKVAENAVYRLYLCKQAGVDSEFLFQIAVDAANNGALDRNAYFLSQLKAKSDELERDYAKIRKNPKHQLNYNLAFPAVVDNFVLAEQGNRRVNVLAFTCVDRVARVVPAGKMIARGVRVDIRTSAWIMGKLLKILTFAHSERILVGRITQANVLIEPEEHYVLVFDWSDARAYPSSDLPSNETRQEIMAAARVVIALLGGDVASRSVPAEGNEDPGFAKYTERLFQLAAGGIANAKDAHAAFYDLIVNDLAWSGFHRFIPQNR